MVVPVSTVRAHVDEGAGKAGSCLEEVFLCALRDVAPHRKIDVVQNCLWLTALLGPDRAAVCRAVARCEQIALD